MAYGSKNHGPELSSDSPSKRFKTQNQEISPPRPPSPFRSQSDLNYLKGKSKLETETESNVCGICLAEDVQDGNCVSRGYIDSCDHYFCFVCIMEWAKVESKCPLCKRRFSTIRRPPKPPLFPCERLVRVPVRDQVHYHFGNASIGPPDPYSDVECTVCHSSADESFLLLCDLCDSASHTHCVGLGATVPEGDWFCRDCTLLRAEHTQSELDTESTELSISKNQNSSPRNITVFDIVRDPESPIRIVERNSTNKLSDDGIGMDKRGQASNAQVSSWPSARTLRQRQNILDRIQALRDNWDSLRNGSLNFSPSSSSSTSQTCEVASDSAQPHSTSSQHERLNSENVPLVPTRNRSIREIDKAWKLMDMAKSLEQKRGRKSMSNQASKSLTRSMHPSANDQQLESVNLARTRQQNQFQHHSLVNNSNNQEVQSEKLSLSVQRLQNCSKGSPASHAPVYCRLASAQDSRSPPQYDFRTGNGTNLPKKPAAITSLSDALKDCRESVSLSSSVGSVSLASNLTQGKLELLASSSSCKIELPKPKDGLEEKCHNTLKQKGDANVSRALSNASKDCRESVGLSSSVGSKPVASNLTHAKCDLPASSSCKKEPRKPKDKGAEEQTPVKLKKKGDNDAKSEIQSLVKLNLKLLAKDKHLGVNAFKEIARSATHSILAACDLETLKPGIRHFPSSVCRHASDGPDVRRSTLMPNSCRECFYVFVKDVVSSIMLEKIQSADAPSSAPLLNLGN